MVETKAADPLEKLFEGLYGNLSDQRPPASNEQLAKALCEANPAIDDLAVAIRISLGKVSISPRQMGVLRVAQGALTDYFSQPVFHPELARHLLAASGGLVAEALSRDGWLLRKKHPMTELLERVVEMARGWHPDNPQAEDVANTLANWLAITKEGIDEGGIKECIRRADEWLKSFSKRLEKLASRLIQAESGVLKIRHARQLTARTINRLVSEREVPDFFAETLETVWVPVFQWVLLNEGERSPLWNNLTRTFGLLLWTLQQEAGKPESRNKLQKVADQVRPSLEQILGKALPDEETRTQLLEEIQIAHFCQTQGRPLTYVPSQPVEGGSVLDEANARISKDLLAEVEAINIGDWFELADSHQRIRLLLKQDESQQLLFVNQSGIKVMTCSFEEFAWQFSSAEISSVVEPVPLADWVEEKLNSLAEEYRARMRVRSEKEAELHRQQEAEEEVRRQAREKALAEARKLEEAQARQAAEKEALLQAERDVELARRESVAAEHGRTQEQRKKRAALLLSSLTMGAWLSFHDEKGQSTRRKLTVVLPSSGKYIFADRTGVDKHEMTRDALVEGIASGAISVVQNASAFDDVLNRVVDGLRQDKTRGGRG